MSAKITRDEALLQMAVHALNHPAKFDIGYGATGLPSDSYALASLLDKRLKSVPHETRTDESALATAMKQKTPAAGLYLQLFHGRKNIDDKLDDWGEQGPFLGPFTFVHTTYAVHIKFGMPDGDDRHWLTIVNDMVYYNGMYYGDWSVCSEKNADPARIQAVDPDKTTPPPVTPKPKDAPNVLIKVEGGVVSDVLGDKPFNYVVKDFDEFDAGGKFDVDPATAFTPGTVTGYMAQDLRVDVKPTQVDIKAALTKAQERKVTVAALADDFSFPMDGMAKKNMTTLIRGLLADGEDYVTILERISEIPVKE